MSKNKKIVSYTCRVIAAIILLQTLFFKFTGAPESIHIFESVGIEPWGRYLSGIAELITAIILFIPRFTWMGALLGINIMTGAIVSHFLFIGIEVQGDGGLLFGLAIITFICCFIVTQIHKAESPFGTK